MRRDGERRSLFYLATKLGCTVAELEDKLTVVEFFEWMAYFDWKAKEEKKAMDRASRSARR